MNKQNKILVFAIALMVVFCVVIVVLLISDKNKKTLLQQASTELVKENEKGKNKFKIDLQSGKVLKIEGDQFEFLQITDNGQFLPENKRKTRTIKITDKTKISARCVDVQNFEMEKLPTKELATDESAEAVENTGNPSGTDLDETCSAPREIIRPEQTLSIREDQGIALLIMLY